MRMRVRQDSASIKKYLCRKKTCRVCGRTAPLAGWRNCGGCPYCCEAETRAIRPGCPCCDGSGTTVLRWRDFSRGGGAMAKYRQYLRRRQPLRFGTLYECSRCRTPWVRGARASDLRPVPKSRRRLFRQWCARPQVLPLPLLRAARAIGAVRYDDFWYVPCRVKLRDGTILDRCVVSFQDSPPLDDWRGNLRLAADIAELMPSPDALPLAVRRATADFWDAPYGGALAGTPDGQYVHVHPGAQFAGLRGIELAQLRLVRQPGKLPANIRIRQVPHRYRQLTCFVADLAGSIRRR